MEGDKETFVFSCSAVMHRLIMLEFTGNKYWVYVTDKARSRILVSDC